MGAGNIISAIPTIRLCDGERLCLDKIWASSSGL
jgi:hypothetical protein